MSVDPAEAMRAARRLDSDHKRALVLAAADALLGAGRPPTIASIARQAAVGRKFIYDHPDLRADIELKAAQAIRAQCGDIVASGRVTGASLRAELENSRAQNQRLTRQLRALENRLSKAEGSRLVADELLPEGVIAELADRQLASRVAELEGQLFEARENLRRSLEELEATRMINRELMQHANRPAADRSGGATTSHTPRTRPTSTPRSPLR